MNRYFHEWFELIHVCNAINGEIIYNEALSFMLMLKLVSAKTS